MDHDPDVPVGATDRRTALKKAAAAAGVVAWTTPVVQVLSTGTAHAQTVTGCSPMVTFTLNQTGKECGCIPLLPEKCCNSFTYLPTASADCGTPLCDTIETGVVTLSPQPPFKCAPGANFPGTFIIGCPPDLVTLSVDIKCEDGVTTTVTSETAPIICKFCVEVTPALVPGSEVPTLNDVTATTSTQPAPPVTTEPTPSVTTEPAAPPADDSTP